MNWMAVFELLPSRYSVREVRVGSLSILLGLLVLIVGCGSERTSPREATEPTDSADWFTDVAESSGLTFQHFNGMSGEFYLAEIMGPGVALFDYDNDGDLDVYAVQGQMLGRGKSITQAIIPPPAGVPLLDRLFRNDLSIGPDGSRRIRFTDVTAQSGIDVRGYGMGVAAGDVNNDGWVDLFLTRLGLSVLLRNNGNGTFTDVTRESGVENPAWGVSASFVDYDRDGWLDVYVGNYLAYSVDSDIDCFARNGRPAYCSPASYRGAPDRLYHNRGNGTFTDVTATARIASRALPSLGVIAADFNGDAWPDIYVANDGTANVLWINQHDGTFKDTGFLSGSALSGDGKPEGSMGVDAGDFDNDGDEDLFMTHIAGEGHNLYVNDGSGLFEDRSTAVGLTAPTLPYTGFGAGWLDFDNDGALDLLTVNGAIQMIEPLARTGDRYPLRQMKQLFSNVGGKFEDVTAKAGAVFGLSEVGRGVAFGDVDNDGDIDVVIANSNGKLRLLRNNIGTRKHWVGLRVLGQHGRDMLGARVIVIRSGGAPALWRRSRSDGSYASANDPRVLVGLGDSVGPVRVRVVWPDGRTEEWMSVPIDRWSTLTQGTGR